MDNFPYFRKISKNISIPVNELGLTETEYALFKVVKRMDLYIDKNWPMKDVEEATGFSQSKIRWVRKKLLKFGVLKKLGSRFSARRNTISPKYMKMIISYSDVKDFVYIWFSKRTLRLLDIPEESNDELDYGKRLRVTITGFRIYISVDDKGLKLIGRQNRDARYIIFKKEEWFTVSKDHKRETFPLIHEDNSLISDCPSWIQLGSGCTSISIPIE